MKGEIFLGYRTDLAMEAAQALTGSLPRGVAQRERRLGKLQIHTVEVTEEEGVKALDKPRGTYVTVTAPPLYSASGFEEEEITAVAQEIAAMLPPEGLVLVVGLGNNDITPDAIGPRAVHQVLATRHISGELAEASGLGSLRAAAAVAPGVLGQTGIETSEIVRAIADDIHPAAIIVIDALAARSTSRLGTTIQIASSGISPGSGVMNKRKELSRETLGVPVVSVGIPTVVDAATLAGDLLPGTPEEAEACKELFQPEGRSMMITPREIDVLVGHASKVIALSINKALHKDLSLEDISYLTS